MPMARIFSSSFLRFVERSKNKRLDTLRRDTARTRKLELSAESIDRLYDRKQPVVREADIGESRAIIISQVSLTLNLSSIHITSAIPPSIFHRDEIKDARDR